MFSPAILEFFSLLQKYNIQYSLGGSAMLVALNLIHPSDRNDWDILTDSPEDDILPLLKNLEFQKIETTYPFASRYIYKINFKNEKIDLIGSFAMYNPQKEIEHFSAKPHLIYQQIPLSNPQMWVRIYELLGRGSKKEILKKYLERLKHS